MPEGIQFAVREGRFRLSTVYISKDNVVTWSSGRSHETAITLRSSFPFVSALVSREITLFDLCANVLIETESGETEPLVCVKADGGATWLNEPLLVELGLANGTDNVKAPSSSTVIQRISPTLSTTWLPALESVGALKCTIGDSNTLLGWLAGEMTGGQLIDRARLSRDVGIGELSVMYASVGNARNRVHWSSRSGQLAFLRRLFACVLATG